MTTQSTEPRFKPGDRVLIRAGGRGHVWRVVRTETFAWEDEPTYLLSDGKKQRTAFDSTLMPAPEETASA